MNMKRFLLRGALVAGAAFVLAGSSWAQLTQTITYRRTDIASGTEGNFSDGSAAGLTPYFTLDSFDTQGGTRQLQAVTLSFQLELQTVLTATNTASSGGDIDANGFTRSTAALYFNTNGTLAGDLNSVGGQFTKPADFSNVPTATQRLTVTSQDYTFTGIAPGTSQTSPVLNGSASTNFAFKIAGYSGGGATNDTVVNQFLTSTNGGGPVRLGYKTFTQGFVGSSGGNATVAQNTADQVTLSVTYTFQPVPAPPAAVSLGIGGLVGMVGTGVNRFRRRTAKRK